MIIVVEGRLKTTIYVLFRFPYYCKMGMSIETPLIITFRF